MKGDRLKRTSQEGRMTTTPSNDGGQLRTSPNQCDIVMKGGITSGVVYPAAVVSLSEKYRFRNIGGTSAGAIAAAMTAAAEYGRQTKSGTAFAGLGEIRRWVCGGGNLFGLFRANRSTRPLLALLTRVLDSPGGQSKLVAALAALYSWNVPVCAAAATPGVLLVVYGVASGHWWAVAFGICMMLVLPLLISLWIVFDCLTNKVAANLYGICSGLDDTNQNDTSVLTAWLANTIDKLAGVEGREEPLTFEDLWGLGAAAPGASPLADSEQDAYARDREREAREINLETITTNLTHGRPYRFPCDTSIFYFDPADFRKLFPGRIVDHMVKMSRKPSGKDPTEPARMESALPRIPLPNAADLPIVVAARMSLSFPLLISAVPLYAVDWGLARNQENREAPLFEKCWFSDGGLSSNFPIHLFDAPVPTRPTFAIDLDAFPSGQDEAADQCKNVWMPDRNGILLETWTRFEDPKPNLGGFLAAIFNAMQNWQDNMQSRVPGFRDRIVHVYLNADEGGMNLNMSAKLLDKLAERGTCAGQRLIDNLARPNPAACAPHLVQPTNWDNHCVVRYRTSMALLENWIRQFCNAYTPEYKALMNRALDAPPCSYAWEDDGQSAYAGAVTGDVFTINDRREKAALTLAVGVPKPQPELVIRPRA
ncbi:MAG: hypothetical protein WCB01_02330 [Candidatus Cybelea sp.]